MREIGGDFLRLLINTEEGEKSFSRFSHITFAEQKKGDSNAKGMKNFEK